MYKACQNSWLYTPFGEIWCIDKGVSRQCKKANRTNSTFGFCQRDNILKGIRSLSKCSNTNNYEYNEEENKMTRAIREELKIMKTVYKNT